MIYCNPMTFWRTDDARMVIARELYAHGFAGEAQEYYIKSSTARDPNEAMAMAPSIVTFERSEEAAIQELVLARGD